MPGRARTAGDRSTREPTDLNGSQTLGEVDSTNPTITQQPASGHNGTSGITLRLPLPHLSLPTVGDIDAKRMFWYGGLGAMATIGILDWPVALVVGAGTVIAARSRRAATPPTSRQEN